MFWLLSSASFLRSLSSANLNSWRTETIMQSKSPQNRPEIFHGNDEQTHKKFQAWRKVNVDGFYMTESAAGQFTIHYAQDKRENSAGRGCRHQGVSDNEYMEDGCYTKARKVCSNSLAELIAWATERGFTTKNCKHCDTKQFPFSDQPEPPTG
jgi:hypothetical protein